MAKQKINKSRQRRKSSDDTQRVTLRLSIECMLNTLMWLSDKDGFEVGRSILVDAARYVRWFGEECQCLDPWVGADLTTRIMTDVAAFDTFRRHLEERPVVDAYVMAR